MSASSHSHTLDIAQRSLLGEDDDDDDICPVCDGECTCNNNSTTNALASSSRLPSDHSPYAASNVFSHNQATSTQPTAKAPSLKIKLTVPRSLLGKRRASSSSINRPSGKSDTAYIAAVENTNTGESSSSLSPNAPSTSALPPVTFPKRRGRPPKAVVAARLAAAKAAQESRGHVPLTASSLSQFSSQSQPSVKRKIPLTHRKINPKLAASRLPSKLNSKSKLKKPIKRRRVAPSDSSAYSSDEIDEIDDDGRSVQFPTFVSASALSGSSSSSDSDSSSLTDFDSDSSIEAEEENYIISEENKAHDKARVRRELLGGDNQRKRNDWIIRPRMKSVGASDAEMEVDDDATEDEDDEDEEAQEDDEEETDDGAPGVSFAGVSTSWSDGEESSFDAELFFANLSSSDSSSVAGDEGVDDVEDDQSDMDAVSLVEAAAAGLIPQLRQELNNLPFEVTQGWDGQIVFTNGLRDGHGILDIDFEVNAARMVVESSASPSATSTDMLTSDIGDADQGQAPVTDDDGATTDEDLVGENNLPNERAMQLFVMPTSVSAIDPMSTLSPVGSPHPLHRRGFRSSSHCESPKPADILAGRIFWDDSEGDSEEHRSSQSRSMTSSRGGLPRTGTFQALKTDHRAIIDGSRNDLPSPHPRVGRIGRGRDLTQSVHGTHVFDSPWNARPFNRTSSMPASSRTHNRDLSSDVPMPSSPDFHPMEPVNLDDVLDSSYLDSDGSDCHGSTTSVNDSDSKKHIKSLRRWDVIPVGAFRQSHSSMNSIDSWVSDTSIGSPTTYSNAMRPNPLGAMLWNNKASSKSDESPGSPSPAGSTTSRRQKRGDRTPTNFAPSSGQQQHNRIPPKTRKELKHEHKLKRKSFGSTHHKHSQQHHFHSHNHHPNMKSRGSSAVQRTNFFSSSPM